jgi:hypothetical protein
MKKCNICQEDKEAVIANFYPNPSNLTDGFNAACKPCYKVRSQKYRKEHYKERSEYNRKWVKANPDKNKSHKLKNRYGISLQDYNEMLLDQNNSCKICKTSNEKLSVDHDHKTEIVRGLLCPSCNLLLGNVKDNVEILKSAIDYLS